MENLYTKDSIESLEPREFVRLKPGVYAGDCTYSTQLIVELFSNSLDEHNLGHGNRIDITYDKKSNIYTIEDNGQGFLCNEKIDNDKTVLEAAFSVLNTSGKYREDGVYEGTSLGAFGIGAKLPCFLSHSLSVLTRRDGKYEGIEFEEGIFKSRDTGFTPKDTPSGTKVSFQPSEEFFTHVGPNERELKNLFNDICCLCPDLTVTYNGEVFRHENGIEDLLAQKTSKDIEILDSKLIFSKRVGKQSLNLGLTYSSSSTTASITPYVNYGLTDSGPHITNIKTIITRALNNWAKENGMLKSSDKNLDGNSLQEGLVVVFNLVTPTVAYDAQVKSRVTNNDFNPFVTSVFTKELELWLDNNPEDAAKIINNALLARKASEAAKKAREAVRNKKKTVSNKVKIMNPDKLKDAEFLGEDSTLLVVEGLSAGASMSVARDRKKYGILMLRGKLINALSNKDDKLLKNEEVQLLFKALGITPDSYNPKDLRYGKVAICTDSDSDGYHIALLIMSALYYFCPEFIEEERLAWLRSPLYIVKNGKKESYFFTDEEMDAARGKIKGEVQRNKGLGSLSAEQARESMFGENQRMDILSPSIGALTLLEDLMGKAVTPRKDFVFNKIDFSEIRE